MRRLFLAGAAALLLATAPAAAQQPTRPARADTTASDTSGLARDTAEHLRITPRKAFLRSIVIPGWGEASAGNYKRGAVFLALAGTSDGMLIATLKRLSSAEQVWQRNIADTAALVSKDTVLMKGPDSLLVTKPAIWHAAHDTTVTGFSLVKSRRSQREDRLFQALFFTLISGVDAYINAQLSDFPAGIGVEPKAGGGYLIRVHMPWPVRRSHR